MSNVPKLRFEEFSDSFDKKELRKIVEISSDKFNPKNNNKNRKCIELEHLSQHTGTLLGYTNSQEQESIKNIFKENQVLYGKLRPYLKKFLKTTFEGVCSSEIWVLNGKEITNNYLFQLVQSDKFNQIANVSSGSKMPRADWKYMAEIPFFYPHKKEQEKIASFLTLMDRRIEKFTKKESLIQDYKKGVMQKIFNQEIRFKDDNGNKFNEWKVQELGDLLIESKKKSTLSGQYDILSSTKNNIVLQSEYFNREIASKDNTGYKILHKNQLVFSPQNLWLGNINVNTKYKIGIVSPSYKVYDFKKNIAVVDYFKYYLKTSRMMYEYAQASEQGASVVRRSLNIDLFNKILVNTPSVNEQTKIANFLSTIDKKIELTNKQLVTTKEFKKALLQQMFV